MMRTVILIEGNKDPEETVTGTTKNKTSNKGWTITEGPNQSQG